MTSGLSQRIIHGPCNIIAGPTDLSDPNQDGKYGNGVVLGNVRMVSLVSSSPEPFEIENESLGEATDILNPAKRWAASFFCRGWDDDAVEQLLTDGTTAAETVTQHRGFEVPGATVPGASALTRAKILLFVPEDPIHVPSLLLYSAVPFITPGASLDWARDSELGLPISCKMVRDSNANMFAIKLLADLSLT
jgi:hypothetical protein